jgi:phage FluMu protein Com
VAIRICPHCKTEIAAASVAAYSDSVECPQCKARLEVAPGSQTIATFCGLVAATIAWRLSSGSGGDLGGVLPTLYAFLAFGVVSPLVVMFTANLRSAPALPAPEPVHSGGGHGGGHH